MSDVILDISAGREPEQAIPLEDTPFRIVLLGDFTARDSRGAQADPESLGQRPTWRIDRDDLGPVLAELAPVLQLRLDPASPPLVIRFRTLDDFHPDRLFERLPLLQGLHDLRRRLKSPATFAAAAAELSGTAAPRPAARAIPTDLLGDILDAAVPPTAEEAMAEAGGDLHSFIQRVLKPHLIPNPDPREGDLVAQVDAAASATLRSILHAPEFQALEGLWRGAEFLLRSLDTSPELQVHLIDCSPAELAAALPAGGDPANSPLHRLLRGQAGSPPWSLLVGGSRLGGTADHVELAAQLAGLAMLLGAPWISAAHPVLAGAPDPAWDLFRGTRLATALGLVHPGLLGRLPYGRGLDECERLAFEELDPAAAVLPLLELNPAFAVAQVLGRGFAERGWGLARGLNPEIDGLPVGTVGRGVQARSVGPGVRTLTEREAERLLERGIMPLAPFKDSDRARLVRLQSVAAPPAPLVGRWTPGRDGG